MNFHESYFSFSAAYNPLPWLERWFNRFNHFQTVPLRDHPVTVSWTARAERQLAQRATPPIVEMQLYFSCVVKKHVLFHKATRLEPPPVNNRLAVCFRPVESNTCDPVEFANNFPIKSPFTSAAATRMHPREVTIDYRRGQRFSEFTI